MNKVEPIRDPAVIKNIEEYLKAQSQRNYMLFLCGIYTGRRITDLLSLQVRDVRGKRNIKFFEKKTKKVNSVRVNEILFKELELYTMNMNDYEYLFQSRQGANIPISRVQAYNILKDAGKAFGIDDLATHSMRKTFGYFMYQQTKDVALVQQLLGHSDPMTTLRYIGIIQDTTDKAIEKLKFEG